MSYFNSKSKQKKKLSLDNIEDKLEIEKELYQEFLRTKKKIQFVDYKHFENIFTNETYYKSLKALTNLEKQTLYLFTYENKTLNEICKILKKSKTEVIKIKTSAILHFKENIEKYKKE